MNVSKRLLANDQQYITIKVVDTISRRTLTRRREVNIGRFVEVLGTYRAAIEGISPNSSVAAATVINLVMNLIATSYRADRRDQLSIY